MSKKIFIKILVFLLLYIPTEAQILKLEDELFYLVEDSLSDNRISEIGFTNFKGSYTEIIKNRYYWVLDNDGRYFVPDYDYDSLIVVQKDKLWGVINLSGEIVYDFIYPAPIHFFRDGVYIGFKSISVDDYGREYSGFFIYNSEMIVMYEYHSLRDYYNNVLLLKSAQSDYYGLVSSTLDTILPFEYTCSSWDKKNFYFSDSGYLTLRNKEKQCGVVDYKGNVKVPFEYDYIDDPLFEVMNITKDSLNGLLDNNMNFLAPVEYDKIISFYDFDEVLVALLKKNDRWYILDSTYSLSVFEELLPDDKFSLGGNANHIKVNRNGMCQIYSVRNRSYILDKWYDNAYSYRTGHNFEDPFHVAARDGNSYIFYYSKNEKPSIIVADKLEFVKNNNKVIIKRENKYYLYCDNGEQLAGPFDSMGKPKTGKKNSEGVIFDYILVEKNGKFGWLRDDGKIVVPIKYTKYCTRISYLSEDSQWYNVFKLAKGNKMYIYNPDGEIIEKRKCDNFENSCK